MKLSVEFKNKIRDAILNDRENYGGNDSEYAKKIGIDKTAFNRLKNGQTEKLLSDTKWLLIANELGVKLHNDKWKIARTQIYSEIEDNLNFCKEYSKSMILADDCGIGKTFCAKQIAKQMKNVFYVDCSQSKEKSHFIRALAKSIGVDSKGRLNDIKTAIKAYLIYLEKPLVILDEAGDLAKEPFLMIKELWNATEGSCGWYMMGADALKSKIEHGVAGKVVGYAEIFDRFSGFVKLVPDGTDDKKAFFKRLLSDVAYVNVENKDDVAKLVAKCINNEQKLRYLDTLIKINT